MPAYELQHNKTRLPKLAASAVGDHVAVYQSASQTDYVIQASAAHRVLGVALASAASPGDPVAVQTEGITVMRAAASIGNGGVVVVASTNGAVGPISAAASAPIPQGKFVIGEAQSAAAAGDLFSVLIKPRSE
jgi:hypothetical protein